MPKFKNGSEAQTGLTVEGVDSKGNAVKGMVVMIHRQSGKDLPDIAVSQNGRLIGDLKAGDFTPVEESKIVAPTLPSESVAKK